MVGLLECFYGSATLSKSRITITRKKCKGGVALASVNAISDHDDGKPGLYGDSDLRRRIDVGLHATKVKYIYRCILFELTSNLKIQKCSCAYKFSNVHHSLCKSTLLIHIDEDKSTSSQQTFRLSDCRTLNRIVAYHLTVMGSEIIVTFMKNQERSSWWFFPWFKMSNHSIGRSRKSAPHRGFMKFHFTSFQPFSQIF